MCRFIESICLRDGAFQNLDLHEERMQRALAFLKSTTKLNLTQLLQSKEVPAHGWWKCRILYDDQSQEFSFEQYQPKPISSFKLINDNSIEYPHKFADRSKLDRLIQMREGCDDIIIVKDGKVTDSWYANLIFKKNNEWFTPQSYLLPGIMREKLLRDKSINLADITVSNIRTFEKVKVINSLLGFAGPEVSIKNIF
jgi:4-amino-4-deoxychorismate lyase